MYRCALVLFVPLVLLDPSRPRMHMWCCPQPLKEPAHPSRSTLQHIATMFRPCALLLSVLVLSGAEASDSSLRGSGAVAQIDPAASSDSQVIGCSCATGGECQCSGPEVSGSEREQDEALTKALLSRTRELGAWWQTQNETSVTHSWSGPLSLMNETTELWVACGRRGGCGCAILVGCGCRVRRGCAGGWGGWR